MRPVVAVELTKTVVWAEINCSHRSVSLDVFGTWVTCVVGRGLRMHIRQLLARIEEAVHHVRIEVRPRCLHWLLVYADQLRGVLLYRLSFIKCKILSNVARRHLTEVSATSKSTWSVRRRISTRASLAELCNYMTLSGHSLWNFKAVFIICIKICIFSM